MHDIAQIQAFCAFHAIYAILQNLHRNGSRIGLPGRAESRRFQHGWQKKLRKFQRKRHRAGR
jgi:hypothetical protein